MCVSKRFAVILNNALWRISPFFSSLFWFQGPRRFTALTAVFSDAVVFLLPLGGHKGNAALRHKTAEETSLAAFLWKLISFAALEIFHAMWFTVFSPDRDIVCVLIFSTRTGYLIFSLAHYNRFEVFSWWLFEKPTNVQHQAATTDSFHLLTTVCTCESCRYDMPGRKKNRDMWL